MDREAAIATLSSLGLDNATVAVSEIEEGSTSILQTPEGIQIALLRRNEKFDTLILGTQPDCPVPSLRAVLETAVLPLSDTYAANVGVAVPERDAVRRRIREASVALDVIAKGRHFSIAPPEMLVHPKVRQYVGQGVSLGGQLPEELYEDMELLNQLHASVIAWSREIDRVVSIVKKRPEAVLSVEEEIVFWSSLDAALVSAQKKLASVGVRITLEILVRNRRATGFLQDVNSTIDAARRKAAAALTLVQGLPIVVLRTADDLPTLKEGVTELLTHVAGKLKVSVFSIHRVLNLVDSMGKDVSRSMERILTRRGALLSIPFGEFVEAFNGCCEVFETWSQGLDQCRKVGREAARKKGETMPPRQKSFLSHLHSHLIDVFDLRSDHEDLHAVLSELSVNTPSLKTAIDHLDRSYATLTKSSESFDHFYLGVALRTLWTQASTSYRDHLSKAELSASSTYRDVIQNESIITSLSKSLRPFRRVLDKHFMVSVVVDAVPFVLSLARQELATLRNREAFVRKGSLLIRGGDVPPVCIELSAYQVLQRRTISLLDFIEDCVGKTQMSKSPDLRDFATDVERLTLRTDPSIHLTNWLRKINVNVFKSNFFIVSDCSDGGKCLEMSVKTEEAMFFKVVQFARENDKLASSLSMKHLELSRACRTRFPMYCILRDAIFCINTFDQLFSRLQLLKAHRVSSFFTVRRENVQRHFEETIQMRWTESSAKLLPHFSKMYAECSALVSDLHLILEIEEEIESVVCNLEALTPCFTRNKLSEETISFLRKSAQRLLEAIGSLSPPTFEVDAVEKYFETHWFSTITRTLALVMAKISQGWANALKYNDLSFPAVVINILHQDSSRPSLWCQPSIWELEQQLFVSLGNSHAAFLETLVECCHEADINFKSPSCVSVKNMLSNFVNESNFGNICKEYASSFVAIHIAVEQLVATVNSWSVYAGYGDSGLRDSVFQVDNGIEEASEVLELLMRTHEDVLHLSHIPDQANGGQGVLECWLPVDVSALSRQILSNNLEVLNRVYDKCSSKAAELSQRVYESISDTTAAIRDASGVDTVEMLITLEDVRANTLPFCEVSVATLTNLEEKFHEVAERICDSSFSQTHSSETWILSEELVANLQSLRELYEQRRKTLLVNRDILEKKYGERERAYQESLSLLFTEFQKIRGDDNGDENSLDSTSTLRELERKLNALHAEGMDLDRLGKALGTSRLLVKSGPEDILIEMKKLKTGIQELRLLDEKIFEISQIRLRDFDPDSVRGILMGWADQASDISNSTGAKREATQLRSKISDLLKTNNLLCGLFSIKLSPQRERDVMNRLFGDYSTESGIGDVTLGALWGAGLDKHSKYLKGVFENAAAEATISEYLCSIERKWLRRKCSFVFQHGVAIVKGIQVLIDELDEHIQGLEAMRGSVHARLFESDRAGWERRLANCRQCLELLAEVQSTWSHLNALFGFGSPAALSLRDELREEFSMFSNVHARFTSLGKRLQTAPGLLEGFDTPSGLDDMLEELASIVRGLSAYLEKQRTHFPRFFFLSDSDLLHVLSISSSDSESIIPYIGKMFPGLSSVTFDKNLSISVVSIVSKEGEIVALRSPIILSLNEPAASWLPRMQTEIVRTLRKLLWPALTHFSTCYNRAALEKSTVASEKLTAHVILSSTFPAQIALLALKTCFTSAVERCLSNKGSVDGQLKRLLAVVENMLTEQRSPKISQSCEVNKRLVLLRDQFIKELFYQKQLVVHFLKNKVNRLSSSYWTHQLRFYSSDEQDGSQADITIRCGQASFPYGWEYLGVGEALVQTSLTSRCYLTLSEALRRGLGGSPFGPAGTGKTETVKALGRHLGRSVAVFNCDESFDSIAVGRILAGACRIGCWVCFDEFNRLSSSILSSTSEQLASLQSAIRKGSSAVSNFYGGSAPISISKGVGVFVTMNPAYSGRRELPANLKSLFRPCAMSVPDIHVIAEVLCLSHGFRCSSVLSKKLVSLFQNLSSVLSSRPHYDFGLRSLKSTISASESLLSSSSCPQSLSVNSFEEDILIRALDEVVKPKLEAADLKIYDNSVSIIFTEASCFTSSLPKDVEEAVQKVITEQNLVPEPRFLEKITQLYSLLQHQNGVMLVGPTGSGKSTVWRTLYAALKRLLGDKKGHGAQGQYRSSVTVLDPKLFSSKQLYGESDSTTREWSDGLFTKILRNLSVTAVSADDLNKCSLHWIVFDGDVDPDWVENLNSVLDDNKILTLSNGERIPLLGNTRILFETDSLTHANPSTVSRCGMVCFGNSLDVQFFMNALKSLLLEICPSLAYSNWLEDVVIVILQAVQDVIENMKTVMRLPSQSILDSILRVLRSSMRRFTQSSQDNTEEVGELSTSKDSDASLNDIFVRLLVLASIKCITASLTNEEQRDVSKIFTTKLKKLDDIQKCLSGTKEYGNYAEVTLTTGGVMKEFSELIPDTTISIKSEDVGGPDVVIPTSTTVRLESLLHETLSLVASNWSNVSPLILCGPPGCGKSMLLTAALRHVPNVTMATLSFSSETSPNDILATLRGHMTLSEGANGTHCLRPRAVGYRVVLFCDEVNLENPDRYGTQHTIAFLRSISEHRGYWHGNPPRWVSVNGIQIVAACNPEGDAGRHQLPMRFLKLCTVVRVDQPNKRDLHIIYKVFVDSMLRTIHYEPVSKVDSLTTAMIEFFSLNTERFCPSHEGPLEPHYIYSPRDLSRWIRGMQRLLSVNRTSALSSNFVKNRGVTIWTDIVFAFCHEARRIFSDRLLRQAERDFVEENLRAVVKAYLDPNVVLPGDFFYTSWIGCEENSNSSPRKFHIVQNPQHFRTLIYQKLRVFAEEEGLGGSWMVASGISGYDDSHAMIDQFAVTDDVLTHLTRLERILCQPLGHAVLMGAPGTGKKTLARFTAWMLAMEVHQVYSHSSYSEADFANDLRLILRKAGVSGLQVMLIFDESNALDSAFLEMMNSILACGDVPGLFSGDERTRLLDDLKQRGTSNGSSVENEQAMYLEFVKRVRRNLHIVFTISTSCSKDFVASKTRRKASASGNISERSPALYNRCTVDWIGDWNKQTLEAVAELKIEVSLGREKDQIIQSVVQMHEIARAHLEEAGVFPGVTPRHYLEFIEQLNRIALEKGNAIKNGVDRHTEGLRRLRNAGDAVDTLREDLGQKADHLQLKEKHASETLQKMVEEQRLAEKSKVSAEQLALAAKEASAKAQNQEKEISRQLANVQSKTEAAREAVGLIRKEFLEELRAMPNPPSGVRIALDGVMMLLDAGLNNGKSETQYSWGSIRSRMRSNDFITSVVNFDAENLPKGTRGRVEKRIFQNPDFDIAKISYASRAAGPLAEWTISVLEYIAVKEITEPLQEEICALQIEQRVLLGRQDDALRQVSEFEERIEICRARYAALVSEAERVRQEIQDAERNLQRAEHMLDSLAEEWDRWVKELNAFNTAAVAVWGNAICGAAFIAYAGPVDRIVRLRMFEKWKNVLKTEAIPFDESLQACEFLTSPGDRGLWSTLRLPTDPTSLENYAILKRSARFPLIIDPSRNSEGLLRKVLVTAHHFVDGDSRQSEGPIDPQITETSFSAKGKKSYLRALESAMRFGTTVVIGDAEKFDKAVTPLLGQESSYGDSNGIADPIASTKSQVESLAAREDKRRKNISHRVVRLGDRDVSLSSGFRMFLTTADISSVPPAAITRSNIVSFELSPAALKSTCITKAIQILSPDLEERRKASLTAKLKYEERKRSLEEAVLATITDVKDLGAELLKGPLLDNLISLKSEVESLEKRQMEDLHASREIIKIESTFEPLGETAVDTFGILRCASAIHPLYSFHIRFFLTVFEMAIEACKHLDLSKELDEVCEYQRSIIRHSYSVVEVSLFPKDRLPFAAALSLISVCSLDSNCAERFRDGDVQKVYECLRDVFESTNSEGGLTDEQKMAALRILPNRLRALYDSVCANEPKSLNSPLDDGLFLLRCALNMPHRVTAAIDKLACGLPGSEEAVHGKQMGSEVALFASLRKFSDSGRDKTSLSDCKYSPILLCARGDNMDVASLVTEHCAQHDVSLLSFAMGKSQTPKWVTNIIAEAIREIENHKKVVMLLKNAHLASKSTLEQLQSELSRRNGELPFLLIIAIEILDRHPETCLATIVPFCRILAFEVRPSFRANLQFALNNVSINSHFSLNGHKDPLLFKKLEVASSWLHTCLLERSSHFPVGFSKHYQFSEADLVSSWDIASLTVSTSNDYKESILDVADMLTASVYGCRIEENTDLDIVRALARALFNPSIFKPGDSQSVPVFSGEADGDMVVIPLSEMARSEYVRSLPLQAPPQWSFMPSNATIHRRVAEGKTALDTVLKLLDGKFKQIWDKNENDKTADRVVRSMKNLQSLKNCEVILSHLGTIVIKSSKPDPLSLYVETETIALARIIEIVLDDLRAVLGLKETTSLASTIKTRELEKELLLDDEGLNRVPSAWMKACKRFSGDLSIRDFVFKLKRCVEELRKLAQNENGTIEISSVLRPAALLEALTFSEAKRRRTSPHNVRIAVSGEPDSAILCRRLEGLQLRGGRWDGERRMFIADGEGKEDNLYLNWQVVEYENEEYGDRVVELPWYDAGVDRRKLAMVRIAVKDLAIEKWRLCGACLLVM